MNVPRRTVVLVLAATLAGGLGLVANPWIRTGEQLFRVLVVMEVTAGMTWLARELVRAVRRNAEHELGRSPLAAGAPCCPSDSLPRRPARCALWLLWLIIGLWLLLYGERWRTPQAMPDDDQLFAESADWVSTRRHLLVPMVDHVMIVPRLATYAALQLGGQARSAAVGAAVSALLFLSALTLLFRVARREWQSDTAGLIAVTGFALSSVYREVIFWYTATTQWLVPLNMLLAGMLLLPPGRAATWRRVGAAALLAAAAPLCFSCGVVVGPLLSLWLMGRHRLAGGDTAFDSGRATRRAPMMLAALAPIAGTVVGTATLVPILIEHGRSFRFDPVLAIVTSVRLALDGLLLRNLGIEWTLPKWLVCVALPLVIALLARLIRGAATPERLIALLGIVVLGYAIAVPFRTWVQYRDLVDWTRYQLFPQLGYALLVTEAVVQTVPGVAAPLGARSPAKGAALVIALAIGLTILHQWRLR